MSNNTDLYDSASISKWIRPLTAAAGGLVGFILVGLLANYVVGAGASLNASVVGVLGSAIAACFGYPLWYFGVRGQDKLVTNFTDTLKSVIAQQGVVVTALTNGKATENAPSGIKPAEVVSTPAPEKTGPVFERPEYEKHATVTAPIVPRERPSNIVNIPQQFMPEVERWFAMADTNPPKMPTLSLPGAASFTPDQLREARGQAAFTEFNKQLVSILPDELKGKLAQEALPAVGCKAIAAVSAAIFDALQEAKSNWFTFAMDSWNYQEGSMGGSLPGASTTSGDY